jgi:hypothetical protein
MLAMRERGQNRAQPRPAELAQVQLQHRPEGPGNFLFDLGQVVGGDGPFAAGQVVDVEPGDQERACGLPVVLVLVGGEPGRDRGGQLLAQRAHPGLVIPRRGRQEPLGVPGQILAQYLGWDQVQVIQPPLGACRLQQGSELLPRPGPHQQPARAGASQREQQ